VLQLRRSPLYIENGADCDCSSLEQTEHVDRSSSAAAASAAAGGGSSEQRRDSFLVTGRRSGDRLTVQLIQPFRRRAKELRRAVRALRQDDVCDGRSVIVDVGRYRPTVPR